MDVYNIFSGAATKNPSLLYVICASVGTTAAIIVGFAFVLWRQRRELNKKIEDAQRAAQCTPVNDNSEAEEESETLSEESEDEVLTSKWPTDGYEEKDEPTDTSKPPNSASIQKDPLEFCEHIQGEVKRTKQRLATKKIEAEMTDEQKERERQAQRDQLAAIFKMMSEQNDKFGITDMDEMQDQMRLYAM